MSPLNKYGWVAVWVDMGDSRSDNEVFSLDYGGVGSTRPARGEHQETEELESTCVGL